MPISEKLTLIISHALPKKGTVIRIDEDKLTLIINHSFKAICINL